MKWSRLFLPLSVIGIFLSSSAFAYDEPVVNLGYTSFLDGGPPSGPGFYFQNYFQYYTTNRLTNKKGKRLPFPRTELDAVADILQLIYLSKKKILGGSLGVSAVLPNLLYVRINDAVLPHVLRATSGMGDLTIGPALQFDPILRKNSKDPLFVQRFEFDVIAPIGHYNRKYAITPSSHFWSIAPYWAATLWITPKWDISTRIHYLWNAKNTRPYTAFGPLVRTTQAGQAAYANIDTDYAITEKLHLGINSYLFYQFTNTLANGRIALLGREERVWSIGPGLLYGLTKNQFLFANLYFERGARNRPQGTNLILRYVLHFG